MPDWLALRNSLRQRGLILQPREPIPVGGGDISAAWRLDADSGPLFMKTSRADGSAMFAAEAEGLKALQEANAIRVPRVLAEGVSGTDGYLVLEWLDIQPPTERSERRLGELLAAQHRVCHSSHGWHRDNTIGSTPQVNVRTSEWSDFFLQHRLKFQLALAAARDPAGELAKMTADICSAARALLDDHRPSASLLHGDLWAGNHAALGNGEPVIFDPAVYFGDRETDLAMTRLFGGFAESFYSAYNAAWPLADGHERRIALYQLYHVLNHVNLFGASYLARALSLVRSFAH